MVQGGDNRGLPERGYCHEIMRSGNPLFFFFGLEDFSCEEGK